MRTLFLATTFFLLLTSCDKRHPPSVPAQPNQPDTQWVDSFFHDYADAFRSKSPAQLLARFTLPLTFLTKNGPVAFADEAHLSANLEALLHRYEQIGAVDWQYRIKEIHPIATGIVVAEIEWQFFDAEHALLYACDTTYFLAAHTKPGPKVMAAIAHNEMERYDEALKRKTVPQK